jgi:hypothetical protein
MDYLLMSYIIYHQGCAAAHRRRHQSQRIPVVGVPAQGRRVLHSPRFAGNSLYTVVFMKIPRGHRRAGIPSNISSRAGGRALAGCCIPRRACCR